MESSGALMVLMLLAVGAAVLWAVNRWGTRAGLPLDIRSRPRPVRGRPTDRPDVGGDTFTAGFDGQRRAGDQRPNSEEPE